MRLLVLIVVAVAFVVLFIAMYMLVSDWFAERAKAKKDKTREFYLSRIDQDLDTDIEQLYKNKVQSLRQFDKQMKEKSEE